MYYKLLFYNYNFFYHNYCNLKIITPLLNLVHLDRVVS